MVWAFPSRTGVMHKYFPTPCFHITRHRQPGRLFFGLNEHIFLGTGSLVLLSFHQEDLQHLEVGPILQVSSKLEIEEYTKLVLY